jgi:hypothetical protein
MEQMNPPIRPFSYLVAPTILVILACLQIYLAHTHNLAPWKGGGFSMFASVDRPDKRFLRCYLVTDQGDVPVQVPDSDLRKLVRAMPTPKRLASLATEMAKITWVLDDCGPTTQREKRRTPQLSPNFATKDIEVFPAKAPSTAAQGVHPRFRALQQFETVPEASYVANFFKVRLEVWRISFLARSRNLIARKLVEVTKERQ